MTSLLNYFTRKFRLLAVLLCCQVQLQAQEISYILFDETRGFNRNYVLDMLRDSNGFYWLATEKGVVRFDGANFSEIHPPFGAWRNAEVMRLYKYKHFLYIIYEATGCLRLNLDTYTFELVTEVPLADLVQWDDKTIHLLRQDGMLIKLENGKQVDSLLFLPRKFSRLQVWNKNLLVGLQYEKLFQVSPGPLKILRQLEADSIGYQLNFQAFGGKLYLYSGNREYIYDTSANIISVNRFLSADGSLVSYLDYKHYTHRKQYYLMNSKSLVAVTDEKHKRIKLDVKKNLELRNFIIQDSLSLLIGTNHGLLLVQEKKSPVVSIDDNVISENDDLRVRRRILNWKENELLLLGGYYNYLYKPDGSLQKISDRIASTYEGLLLGNDVYIGSEGRGIIRMRMPSGKLEFLECPPINPTGTYLALSRLEQDSALLVGGQGLFLFYPRTGKSRAVAGHLKSMVLKTILLDTVRNCFWVGGDRGLYRLTRAFQPDGPEQGKVKGLKGLNIAELIISRKTGDLWVAHENGIDIVDARLMRVLNPLPPSVFVNPKVVSLLEDKSGRIWAGTYDGVIGIDPFTRRWSRLGKKNNLMNAEFNYKSAALMNDGRLIFGGLNGYDIIDPAQFRFDQSNARGMITGYERITGKDTVFQLIGKEPNPEIWFNIEKEALRIYLSAKDMLNASFFAYEYRLDEGQWIKISGSPYINLFNLQPDRYRLQVRAFDEFGSMVYFPDVSIVATVSFFRSSIFLWGLVAASVISLFLVAGTLLVSRRRERKLKENISMDLHDEVGTILTRALYVSRSSHIPEKISRLENYLSEALYSLRVYIHTMNRNRLPLQQLADDMREILQNTFYDAAYVTRFQVHGLLDSEIDGALYRDIKLCLFEILNNTLKHARSTEIILEMDVFGNRLEIAVEDNGQLTSLAHLEGKGNGMKNIRKRMKNHRGKVHFFIPEAGHGLGIKLEIPI